MTSGTNNMRANTTQLSDAGYSSPTEFLHSVMQAGVSHSIGHDSRLTQLAAGADEQSTVSDPYGGFTVPTAFSPNMLSVGNDADPLAALTTKIDLAPSGKVIVPARTDKDHSSSVSGGLRVYRRNETDTSSSSRMEMEQIKLEATSLFGLTYTSEEILERSASAFIGLMEAGFQDEFASRLMDERLSGTGVGQYEGVLNSPAVVSVAKETGQAAATVVYENVVKMRARCWGYGRAVWLANEDVLPQLMTMSLAVGTGGSSVWQPSAREDAPDMLLGRPLFFNEACETVGTVGDVILGNWSQYLEGYIGTPGMVKGANSMHVRFINHERTFKFWMENDGRCWWRAALTPKNSTATLSPFVSLATRA
jgi:HK97 family phage major capsid protein